jgi:hypothetical protein
MKLFFTIFISFTLSSFSAPNELRTIYHVIKHVETNDNSDAIGDNGKAYGVVQIHKIAVLDVNRIYGTNYSHSDAFDRTCAEEIFMLYINAGIKRFTLTRNRSPTEMDIVRMWNGGLYKGYLYKSTMKYYKRYITYKKALCE